MFTDNEKKAILGSWRLVVPIADTAADLFYKPGGATSRSVTELYDVLELEPAAAVAESIRRGDAKLWPQSA